MQQIEYWIASDGQSIGPLTEEVVRGLLAAGKIQPHDHAWHTGLEDWRPLREIMPPPAPIAKREQQSPLPIPVESPKLDANPKNEDHEGKNQKWGWLALVGGIAALAFRGWLKESMNHGALAPYAGGVIIIGCVIWFITASAERK